MAIQSQTSEVTRRREELGFTKSELASLAGVSPALVTRIENGERRATPRVMVRLARALELPVARLFPLPLPPIERDEATA
jgi:transcriptional regulator with XRE-family HTH domain